MNTNKIQNYINHIVFVIDKSGSMANLADSVVKVFDNQVKHLAKRSQETGQETRVSVYLFDRECNNLIYDMDVLRLPSLKGYYNIGSSTGLLEATLISISDLKKTPEIYGDHSFLIYIITDGQNTDKNELTKELNKTINDLKDHWTLGIFVPDQTCAHYAKQYGFPSDNISIWNTSSTKDVDENITKSTDNYFKGRAAGIRGTKTLFKVDVNFGTKEVKRNLDELGADDYILLDVRKKSVIQKFIESWKIPFRKGANYYQLTKKEAIQNYKQVLVQDKMNGKVYAGINARKLLGLPDHEVKVEPGDFDKFDIFVQSTSNNRNLMPGTKLIVLK